MSRTTGSLQQVFQELLQDEINHLTKFWGFGKWLYTDFPVFSLPTVIETKETTQRINFAKVVQHLAATVTRMMKVLHWESWSFNHRIELVYTFLIVWQRMWSWNNSLTFEYWLF